MISLQEVVLTTAIYIIIALAAATVAYLTSTGKLEDDSFGEEIVEVVIEKVYDVDIDLSPGSRED